MKKLANDRRVIRTKKLLRNSLTELMNEKSFDEIKVSDITEKADINRGTFYLHYHDKYDLLEQNENEIIEEIKQIRSKKGPRKEGITSKRVLDQPFPFMTKLFEYIQDNADFMKVILGPKAGTSFQIKLKEVMRANMASNILTHLKEEHLLVPIEYLSAYAVSAQLGVIQHWLDSGMKETPEEVSLIISRLVFNDPYILIKHEAH
ncbi:TetR/AcrR family transcriptional regulator C-terminal domain-containing protein [Bacillus massiliigorillae]|uniref:TetR/AcrR family transcriptional regulator C-terminal domain-containing protein n=1 Tax=Bacillus massiliigorillae TaxID=1243664 RepID=UPI00039A7799|nr:TetR/AcrR family transcriptional regulator C-terminal domain-containing protein [Bacillus massiliigorillae]